MTDRPDELTAAQAEQVRRLLADARHDAPIPDDVASRLDAVIAGLAAERAGVPADSRDPDLAPVVPLRRRWPRVLVAAAAVAAVGYGGSTLVGSMSGSMSGGEGDAARTADSQQVREADEEAVAPEMTAPSAATDSLTGGLANKDGGVASASELTRQLNNALPGAGRVQLRADRSPAPPLEDLRSLSLDTAAQQYAAKDRVAASYLVADRCGPVYDVPGAQATYATYASHLALVLFYPEANGIRLVEVFDCQSPTPRRAVRQVVLGE